MTDLFKKAALFNAELISIGAEKIKEVADDFVRKGILDDQEARRFVTDVREKLTTKEQELGAKLHQVQQQVTQQVTKLGGGLMTGNNPLAALGNLGNLTAGNPLAALSNLPGGNLLGDLFKPLTPAKKAVEPVDVRIDELESQLDELRLRKDTLKARANGSLKKENGSSPEVTA
jgi:polyhydroxyalkanoate synthesis regulator phasin